MKVKWRSGDVHVDVDVSALARTSVKERFNISPQAGIWRSEPWLPLATARNIRVYLSCRLSYQGDGNVAQDEE